MVVDTSLVSTTELFRWCDKLTGTLDGYKTIESFMSNYKFAWAYDPYYHQICNYLKATMYYDEIVGCWLEK